MLWPRVHFEDENSIPSQLLEYTADYLRRYPNEAQDIYPALKLIDVLSQSILACPTSVILPILKALQPGLCVWLHAESTIISDEDYDHHVRAHVCLASCVCLIDPKIDYSVLLQLFGRSSSGYHVSKSTLRTRGLLMRAIR